MTDADAETADRWATAAGVAEGITDYGISRALRTYFLFHFPVGVLLLTGIGFLISLLIFGNFREEWPTHLLMGLLLASLGTGVAGFIYARKRVKPQVRPQRTAAVSWLNKQEQKTVSRQISGRITPVQEQLTVTRGAAVQARQSLALFLLIGPSYLLLLAAQILNSRASGALIVVFILCLGLFLAGYVAVVWQFRQAGRFLENTSSFVSSESD
ncbi:hypothetical protein [Arthrobacter sp. NPDC093139]|uniref:hypothetical protein n=1 Tax=Arthrobacter sp. NPDC093139 TaxID=3363945 RepID=UPI00380B6406